MFLYFFNIRFFDGHLFFHWPVKEAKMFMRCFDCGAVLRLISEMEHVEKPVYRCTAPHHSRLFRLSIEGIRLVLRQFDPENP
jgi:hypothetical protein